MDLTAINERIRPLDEPAMAAARARWDYIAKPVGSLGQLESLVTQLAGVCGSAEPRLDKRAVIVMCADNGVLAQGVAMTPGEISAMMTRFIAQGRSSVCAMARQARSEVIAVDIGLASRVDEPTLLDRHIANGTADMTHGPAMSRDEAVQAIQVGMDMARACREQGCHILATGEMGIGNTTTSSAVAAVLLGQDVATVTGRGVGLDEQGLQRKLEAIRTAVRVNRPNAADPLDVLRKLGGFDIAGLCGVFLGGALYGLPVVIDGFISSVAALTAARLCPASRQYMLASHLSAEPAARLVLDALDLQPVIHGGLRLGEGTGAVALLPLLDMALAVYYDVITYGDIGM